MREKPTSGELLLRELVRTRGELTAENLVKSIERRRVTIPTTKRQADLVKDLAARLERLR